MVLRFAIKAMNDLMGPGGLVPPLLVFGVIPSLPVINKNLHDQRERMAALSFARAEMATITAELRIAQALSSKLPPARKFAFAPGDHVRVYKEQGKPWCGPVRVVRTCVKEVTVSDGV